MFGSPGDACSGGLVNPLAKDCWDSGPSPTMLTDEDLWRGDPKRFILLRGFVFLEGGGGETREQDKQAFLGERVLITGIENIKFFM